MFKMLFCAQGENARTGLDEMKEEALLEGPCHLGGKETGKGILQG